MDKQDVKEKPQDSSPEEGDNNETPEKSIPYSRFKEVVGDRDKLKEELNGYKEEKDKEPEVKDSSEKEETIKSKEETIKSTENNLSVDSIINVLNSTKGLEDDEISELQLRAKANGKSLSEARKDDNYKLWLEAKRAKVEQENKVPEPDSKKVPEEKTYSDYSLDDYTALSPDEKLKYNEWRKSLPKGTKIGF